MKGAGSLLDTAPQALAMFRPWREPPQYLLDDHDATFAPKTISAHVVMCGAFTTDHPHKGPPYRLLPSETQAERHLTLGKLG